MGKAKKLSKKQLAVIEDLFAGELGEQAVLDKYNISRTIFNKWLADEHFVEQFNERIASSFRQSQLIIARYAPLAAAKLVQLTESDKEETSRKACLDIISMPSSSFGLAVTPAASVKHPSSPEAEPKYPTVLSEQTASRLLAALAEEQASEER
jgi:hypothetical protein